MKQCLQDMIGSFTHKLPTVVVIFNVLSKIHLAMTQAWRVGCLQGPTPSWEAMEVYGFQELGVSSL